MGLHNESELFATSNFTILSMKAKPLRKKKCKACGDVFQPVRPFQEVCKPFPCSLDLAKAKNKKAEDKHFRERKKDLRPITHWLKVTQEVFNEYIRKRDRLQPCISCRTIDSAEFCAGHFRSRGAASNLRFNEDNVNRQCNKHCNQALSGNIQNYRIGLIAKIGLERVEALENNNDIKKYTRQELESLRTTYRDKIRAIID